MNRPEIVSRAEWLGARKALLAKEKEFTHQRDAVNAQRRRLPMVRIDKNYLFESLHGPAKLYLGGGPRETRADAGRGATSADNGLNWAFIPPMLFSYDRIEEAKLMSP